MKVTKQQLAQIIKEELEQQLQEREAINHPITYAHKEYLETLMDLYHEQLGTPMHKKLPEDVSRAMNALLEMLYRDIQNAAAQGDPR